MYYSIMVECAYPRDSAATGFQMIAWLSNSSEVHKLYANKTTNRQTPASVVVEGNGTYQVTVFAIRGERGIVDSNVEYSVLHLVENLVVSTTTSQSLTSSSPTSSPAPVTTTPMMTNGKRDTNIVARC